MDKLKEILKKILAGTGTQEEVTQFYLHFRHHANCKAESLFFNDTEKYNAINYAMGEVTLELAKKTNIQKAKYPVAYIERIIYYALLDFKDKLKTEPPTISYEKYIEHINEFEELEEPEDKSEMNDLENKQKFWKEYDQKVEDTDRDWKLLRHPQPQPKPKKVLKVNLFEIPEKERKIIEFYLQGFKQVYIANKLGLSPGYISRIIKNWMI